MSDVAVDVRSPAAKHLNDRASTLLTRAKAFFLNVELGAVFAYRIRYNGTAVRLLPRALGLALRRARMVCSCGQEKSQRRFQWSARLHL